MKPGDIVRVMKRDLIFGAVTDETEVGELFLILGIDDIDVRVVNVFNHRWGEAWMSSDYLEVISEAR